ncbi:M23 family metallopeptidase [Salirhabdus sp. Marseille-P4669]|uniref:M23 family metallopeptidase n=1 Tax=Salirhabdus sp. Marseille-P4669 TaxID=2042310 RepID=UPI000C79B0C1|nr:M23 family metallopeptidase [Salirhabdus sp. Marseille-P4669]
MKTLVSILILGMLLICSITIEATETPSKEGLFKERMALYKKTEALTQIPWYYFAAIDQYEHNVNDEEASKTDIIGITIPLEKWNGIANPNEANAQPIADVDLFNGFGKDGNGDNYADRTNDEDILYAFAEFILNNGWSKQDIKIALWNYYQRELTVQSIMNMAKVYKTFNTLNLEDNVFPVPLHANYSYRNTWGSPRGFGGRRIHEGTDIFANYGVPVRSTTYGVIEMKGWNRFGGWRIGIRDTHNIYHYYAHLNGFEKNVEVGNVVKPGDVVGYVGASGYGPPGTSGKFPPHLHYGMYRDNGKTEWSFDPYPYLKKWERLERVK